MAPTFRVYMTFFLRSGWYVQFLEADLRTPLPRTYAFKDPKKICELAQHAVPRRKLWMGLEREIANGRGGCFLNLTTAQ
jgi:hypothetical protein